MPPAFFGELAAVEKVGEQRLAFRRDDLAGAQQFNYAADVAAFGLLDGDPPSEGSANIGVQSTLTVDVRLIFRFTTERPSMRRLINAGLPPRRATPGRAEAYNIKLRRDVLAKLALSGDKVATRCLLLRGRPAFRFRRFGRRRD